MQKYVEAVLESMCSACPAGCRVLTTMWRWMVNGSLAAFDSSKGKVRKRYVCFAARIHSSECGENSV